MLSTLLYAEDSKSCIYALHAVSKRFFPTIRKMGSYTGIGDCLYLEARLGLFNLAIVVFL